MSRVADLLNDPIEEDTKAVLPPIRIPKEEETRESLHEQQPSIVSPLEALALEGQSSPPSQPQQTISNKELDKWEGASKAISAEVIPIPPETTSQVDLQLVQNGLEDDSRNTPQSVETILKPIEIKKEESQGPASIRGLSPAIGDVKMPQKNVTRKRAGPKKPTAKRRKLDNRADTPQSQRSGTPNSTLGAKTVAKSRKQSSATPLHSSPGPEEEGSEDESDDGVYCICRKGDDHTWMIGCEGGCDDWFHGRCIGIDQKEGKLIDKFICPNCTDSKGEQTTWKILCRLEGCREPAAISGPRPSKYCCDDHAAQFFRRFIKKGLGVDLTPAARKRRKDNLSDNSGNNPNEPAHLRGGLLSLGELNAITAGVGSCKDFRSLGESIPSVHEVRDENAMQLDGKGQFTNNEAEQLETAVKRAVQLRHQLETLENREKFLSLVKTRAKGACEEFKKKDKSMKDMCGFDRRLRLSDEEFDVWCESMEGKEAFSSGKLMPEQVDADGDANMTDAEQLGNGLCLKKRCKQHEGWFKLHTLEYQYGASDVKRELARVEEQRIRERATIRQLESNPGLTS